MFREDWLQRQMKALSELIARVAGLLRSGQPTEAREVIRDEAMRVLGADPTVLAAVDDRTVFVLLGDDPKRVARYGALLSLEADAHEASGDAEYARALRGRAERLSEAAMLRAEAAEQK
jgi:hypothetical protein